MKIMEGDVGQDIEEKFASKTPWATGVDVMSASHFFSHVEKGNCSAIEQILKEQPDLDLDRFDHHGQTPLHHAASSGHCELVELLLTRGADLRRQNKRGDYILHCTARHGHVEVLKLLRNKGIDLNLGNKEGEAAIHLVSRSNHLCALEFLCSEGVDVNRQDKHGDIALHTACWCGQEPEICRVLCSQKSNLDIKNNEEEAPIHFAAGRGNVECVKILIDFGANIDIIDKRGSTPLHLACRRGHGEVAMLLLQSGCQLDIVDQLGETPLHSACHSNLVPVVQTMCSFGCKIDLVNKSGSSPLHIATRTGHTEAVRCLLLSGALAHQTNENGVTSEVLAISQGHNEVAELIGGLKDKQVDYIRQLLPNEVHVERIKLKLFGDSGVGKTALVESLKCGFIGSLLRKAGIGGSNTGTESQNMYCLNSALASQKEIRKQSISNGESSPNRPITHASLKSRAKIKRSSTRRTSSTSSNAESVIEIKHEHYTRGIAVQQTHIPGAGDLSVWEFSGYEPYFLIYDHFIGDSNCIHAIVLKSTDSREQQLKQICFWLEFIRIRLPAIETLGKMGRSLSPSHIILVATHANEVKGTPEQHRSRLNSLHFEVVSLFSRDFSIYPKIINVDSSHPMSANMKTLRNAIYEVKGVILQHIPATSQFYNASIAALPLWQKNLSSYPVVTWSNFKDYIRGNVNILACEEHLRGLIYLLQLSGEVVFIEAPKLENNMVVINPKWLGQELIAMILDRNIQLSGLHPDGVFSRSDLLDLVFGGFCGDLDGYSDVLEALEVCSKLEDEHEYDDVAYEIPSIISMSKPSSREVWDPDDIRFLGKRDGGEGVFGGARLIPFTFASKYQLRSIFPRIQTKARHQFSTLRSADSSDNEESNGHYKPSDDDALYNDLNVWRGGFKCTRGNLEVLVAEERDDRCEWIEIKARGQRETSNELFYFFQETLDVVTSTIESCCPSLEFQCHYMSPLHLSQYRSYENVDVHLPRNILIAQKNRRDFVKKKEILNEYCISCKNSMSDFSSLAADDSCSLKERLSESSQIIEGERLCDLLAFGSEEIFKKLVPGVDLPISRLSIGSRRQLCSLLDPPNPIGQDWCLLSVFIGQSKDLPLIDNSITEAVSRTDQVLMRWARSKENPRIRNLMDKLLEIGRNDAIEALLNFIPVFEYQETVIEASVPTIKPSSSFITPSSSTSTTATTD